MVFCLELVSLAVTIGLVCLLLGRLVACAMAPRWLRTVSTETLCAAAFLGTALCMLGFGWFSYLGFSARPAACGVAALACLLAAVLLWQNRLGELLAIRRPGQRSAVLVMACVLAIAILFMPPLLGDAYAVFSDYWAYASVAECLQGHGFGLPVAVDPQHPVSDVAWHFQNLNQRMGPIFLLAMVESLVPGSAALLILPAVNAWGLVLNVLGVFLLCRWALHADRRSAAACALFVAVVAGPLQFSAARGFFCQVYGTASLAFALAVLARLAAPGRRDVRGALVLAISASFVLSAYSELSPILFIAGVGFIVASLRLERHRRGLALFVALAILWTAAIANVELVRAVRSVLLLVGLRGVGSHIPWTGAHFLAFALGVERFRPASPLFPFGLIPAGLAVVAGLVWAVRRRRTVPLLLALATFAALAIYFRFWAHDPWTDEIGHTWSLFKLCQWSFPFFAVLELAGLQTLVRRTKMRQAIAWTSCLVLGALSVPVHFRQAKDVYLGIQTEFATARPLSEMRELRERLAGAESLYLIHDLPLGQRAALYAALLPRHTFQNGWANGTAQKPNRYDRDQVPADTSFVTPGPLAFGQPSDPLPCRLCRVDPRRPFLAISESESPPQVTAQGAVSVPISSKPIGFLLWSPQSGDGLVSLTCESESGESLRLRLVCGSVSREFVVNGPEAIVLPVNVRAGVNGVRLEWLDAPADAGTPRVLRLSAGRFELRSADSFGSVPAAAVSRPGAAANRVYRP